MLTQGFEPGSTSFIVQVFTTWTSITCLFLSKLLSIKFCRKWSFSFQIKFWRERRKKVFARKLSPGIFFFATTTTAATAATAAAKTAATATNRGWSVRGSRGATRNWKMLSWRGEQNSSILILKLLFFKFQELFSSHCNYFVRPFLMKCRCYCYSFCDKHNFDNLNDAAFLCCILTIKLLRVTTTTIS